MKSLARRYLLVRCFTLTLCGHILLLLAPAMAAAQQSSTGAVNVRVVGEEREELIDQAEVRLLTFAAGSPSRIAYTDGSGRVTFHNVTRGSYYVEVDKPGYEKVRQSVDVNPNGNEFVPVNLRRLPNTKRGPDAKTGTVSAAASNVPQAARDAFERGKTSLKDDPARSVEHFRLAIKEHPGYAEAHAMLGLAHIRLKESAEAASALSKSIELDSKLAFAYTLLGKLRLEEKNFPEAERLLRQSLSLDPQAWDANYEMSRCYFNMGKLDQALRHARRAHDVPGAPSSTHLLLFDIYMRQRDRARALRELQEFAKEDPTSPFMPRVRQMIERLRSGEFENR